MNISKDERKLRIYQIWRLMVGRCHNKNWNNYYTRTFYRDKGIIVCDEWRYDYFAFKEWALLSGYDDHLSIDRIDPDGNYTPENCRWITLEENRRRARRGRKPISENAKEVGQHYEGDHCKADRQTESRGYAASPHRNSGDVKIDFAYFCYVMAYSYFEGVKAGINTTKKSFRDKEG